MRKTLDRFLSWAFAPRESTYQADFDDVAEMVIVAHALRAEGIRARFSHTPLRLVVTVRCAAGGVR